MLKEILDSDLLAKAFDTSEGKQILNGAADLITSNVMSIVRNCTKDEGGMITDYAKEINTVYKLMVEWAKTIMRGQEHKSKMK